MAETETPASSPAKKKSAGSGWISLLVDYAPLLVFLGAYRYYAPVDKEDSIGVVLAVVHSTIAFVITSVIALIVSKWRLGKVSRMLWLSTILIVGFGGLTILLRDPFFVQVKPTVLYLFFGAVLLFGWWKGKALLQWLLEAAFEGLNDEGWLKLSRNWGLFFFFLAALNEVLRLTLSFGDWLTVKVPVFAGISFLFTFAQLPMLLKHGLAMEAVKEEETTLPPQ